jgi:2-methylcitrate dehydratase PrpD
MDALLDAAVRGYEAMIALGGTFDTFHYARWHNTSTAGGFGATAATGSLFGLAPDQMVSALGHAASVAGGLWHMRHAPGAMTKQFHVRHAVETGLRAAQLAHHGLVGSPAILEGPQGLYAAMTKVPEPMAVPERWRIEEVSFKPWAACRHAHPAIDAALLLRGESALTLPVTVETYADAVTFCDRPEPKTVTEAKFSIQHAVAVVALRGEPQPADFEPDAIGDPELARCRASVEVREAADISARYPEHFGARLTAAGRTVELVDTRGDPERPLSPQGVVRKARQLFDWGGLDRHQADRAVMLASEGSDAAAILRLLEDGL